MNQEQLDRKRLREREYRKRRRIEDPEWAEKQRQKCREYWRRTDRTGQARLRRKEDPVWAEKERERIRRRNRRECASGKRYRDRESTTRKWLAAKMSNIQKTAKKYKREITINVDFLCQLWEAQDGKCALTGVRLTTKYGCPFGASPDRIDSSKGYTPGNVQLVCKAINLAKNNSPDPVILEWLQAVRQVI